MTNKIIDIAKWLGKKDDDWVKKAINIIDKLPPEQADLIVRFIASHIILEVETGLGLHPLPETDEELDLLFYHEIEDIYKEAAHGCYFCDKTIDANAVEITKDTPICAGCQLKAANLLTACGIDPVKLFTYVLKPRTIQKARLIEEEK